MTAPHKNLRSPFVIRELNTVGYKTTPPIPAASMPTFSFLMLVDGEMFTEVGEDTFLVKSGGFLLIPPMTPFSIKWYNNSRGYMGGFSDAFLKDSGCSILHLGDAVMSQLDTKDVVVCDHLMGLLISKKENNEIQKSVLDLIIRLADAELNSTKYAANKTVSRFLKEVFNRNKPILTVSEYAAELGIVANSLNKAVKQKTGKSAGEWIDISRMTYAKLLLKNKDLSIIDISNKVGIEDQSYFARLFKKIEGVSPSQFRNME